MSEVGLAQGLIPTMVLAAECLSVDRSPRLGTSIQKMLPQMFDAVQSSPPGGLVGRFGSCIGAIRIAELLGDDQMLMRLRSLLVSSLGVFWRSTNCDFLSGMAGVVAGLQWASSVMDFDIATEYRLGIQEQMFSVLLRCPGLLPLSFHEPTMSWRCELGFGHGLAGVVYGVRVGCPDSLCASDLAVLDGLDRWLLALLEGASVARGSVEDELFADACARLHLARPESICDGLAGVVVAASASKLLKRGHVLTLCENVRYSPFPIRLGLLHGCGGLMLALQGTELEQSAEIVESLVARFDSARSLMSVRAEDLFRGGLGVAFSLLALESRVPSSLLAFHQHALTVKV